MLLKNDILALPIKSFRELILRKSTLFRAGPKTKRALNLKSSTDYDVFTTIKISICGKLSTPCHNDIIRAFNSF